MSGKIIFQDERALARFLTAFVGCTATFRVQQVDETFVLEFLGGF